MEGASRINLKPNSLPPQGTVTHRHSSSTTRDPQSSPPLHHITQGLGLGEHRERGYRVGYVGCGMAGIGETPAVEN